MSHYSKIKTHIVEKDLLLKTLRSMGYEHVRSSSGPQPLYGYRGDRRPEKAHVIIRREYLTPASNDIGFLRKAQGNYVAIVSEYDLEMLGKDWVDKVYQQYAELAVTAKLEKEGFDVFERKVDQATQKVHLVLMRRG